MARIVTIALAVGLTVAAISFLGSSLQVPGPAERASTEVMRERGAAGYFDFCSWPKFEPRFWPECRGDADDWRARGATALVAHCTLGEPSRMFGAEDCVSQDRPLFALSGAPSGADLLKGAVAAALALGVLLAASVVRGTAWRRTGARSGSPAAR
jgi:hypothetical protein